jgi:KDO2-lipid IV(A) lauroyltransferase
MSWLPLSFLYLLADVIFFFIYHVFGYRKRIVLKNIYNAFPQRSDQEKSMITLQFYHFLADLIVETIWCFSLTEKRVAKRFNVINPELLNKIYKNGQSVILILGHYGSWEIVISSLNLFIRHKVATIYIPLTSNGFDRIYYDMRTRFGTEMISKKAFSERIKLDDGKLRAFIFGADQSPSKSKNIYWTKFLNQDTAVAMGAEKYARLYNMPVIFTHFIRQSRGNYSVEFQVVSANPGQEKTYAITENHVRLLETMINKNPGYWLWSHKRWKKSREPDNIEQEDDQPTPVFQDQFKGDKREI